MDEPTAPLTNRESEDLYRITEGLRDKGVSIIFISHRMEDMYRLASAGHRVPRRALRGHVEPERGAAGRPHHGHGRPRDHAVLPEAQGRHRGGDLPRGRTLPHRVLQGRVVLRSQGGDPRHDGPDRGRPHRGVRSHLRRHAPRQRDASSWTARSCTSPIPPRQSSWASATFRRTGCARASCWSGSFPRT